MADVEHRCFIGGLAWATTDQSLDEAFSQFGEVIESKIINDRETGRSRGFGFVTFKDDKAMRDAIEGMNGQSLDGRSITVNEAQSRGSGGGGGSYGGTRKGCNTSKKSEKIYPDLSRHSKFKHRPRPSNVGVAVCAVGDQSARLKTRDVTFPDGTTLTFAHLVVTKHNTCTERDSRQKITDEEWAEGLAVVECMEKVFGAKVPIQKDKELWTEMWKRESGRHLDGYSSPV